MKKIISKILLILVILLVILIFAFTTVNIVNKNRFKDKSVHELDNVLGYTNSLIDVYKGKIPASKISNKIQIVFETYLPSISDKIIGKTENNLEEYYDEDSERIKMNLGIYKKEEFVQFAKDIQKIESQLSDFTKLTYIEDSYQNIDDKEILLVSIIYKNGKELRCKVQIQEKDANINLKFEVVN